MGVTTMSEKKKQIREALERKDMTTFEALVSVEEEERMLQNIVDSVATAPQTALDKHDTIITLQSHLKERRAKE